MGNEFENRTHCTSSLSVSAIPFMRALILFYRERGGGGGEGEGERERERGGHRGCCMLCECTSSSALSSEGSAPPPPRLAATAFLRDSLSPSYTHTHTHTLTLTHTHFYDAHVLHSLCQF